MKRLDLYLAESGLAESRTQAKRMIEAGGVTVDGRTVTKCAYPVEEGNRIAVSGEARLRYVSRGGLKLEGALAAFRVDPRGMVCADIGASSGGFTDCLLQHGAARVYAVDSGTAQLHEKLRGDPRVISLENRNARDLCEKDLGEKCDLCVMDVSFISQTKLFSAVSSVLKEGGCFISLIKPQFEVGRSGIGKGGIVKSETLRRKALQDVIDTAGDFGLVCRGTADSPIEGGDGNHEFLGCFLYRKTEIQEKDESL